MIHPQQAWCIQVSITELCWPATPEGEKTACSNCTKGIAHIKKRHIMSLDDVERAVETLRTFPTESLACPQGRRKVVGCFGAEPLHHPKFPEIVDIFTSKIPDVWNRGLWTSMDWPNYKHTLYGEARPHVERLIGKRPNGGVWEHEKKKHGDGGYLNWNQHKETQVCMHSPIFIGIDEVVTDEKHRNELISKCPYQRDWSPLIGPDFDGQVKFFFCEIAATHSRTRGLNVGVPLSPDCWKGTIDFVPDEHGVPRPVGPYAHQIVAACNGCSGALPTEARRDREFKDDISPKNLVALQLTNSPMIARGDFVPFDEVKIAAYNEQAARDGGWDPVKYIKPKE